jgi:hypothetical protein
MAPHALTFESRWARLHSAYTSPHVPYVDVAARAEGGRAGWGVLRHMAPLRAPAAPGQPRLASVRRYQSRE